MEEECLVSLILPYYNVDSVFFSECIDSILSQSYQNLEVIIIDDGSDEEHGLLCDAAAERCRESGFSAIVFHTENRGVSAARNLGMQEAKGDYFCFIDTDDLLHCQYVEKLLYAAVSHHAPAAACGFAKFWETSEIGQTMYPKKDSGKLYRGARIFKHLNTGYLWNKIYRAEEARQLQFDTELKMCEDAYYLGTFLDFHPACAGIKEVLYYHRVNPWSVTGNLSAEHYHQALHVWTYLLTLQNIKENQEIFRIRTLERAQWELKHLAALVHDKPENWKADFISEKEDFLSQADLLKERGSRFMQISCQMLSLPSPVPELYLKSLYLGKDYRNWRRKQKQKKT